MHSCRDPEMVVIHFRSSGGVCRRLHAMAAAAAKAAAAAAIAAAVSRQGSSL